MNIFSFLSGIEIPLDIRNLLFGLIGDEGKFLLREAVSVIKDIELKESFENQFCFSECALPFESEYTVGLFGAKIDSLFLAKFEQNRDENFLNRAMLISAERGHTNIFVELFSMLVTLESLVYPYWGQKQIIRDSWFRAVQNDKLETVLGILKVVNPKKFNTNDIGNCFTRGRYFHMFDPGHAIKESIKRESASVLSFFSKTMFFDIELLIEVCKSKKTKLLESVKDTLLLLCENERREVMKIVCETGNMDAVKILLDKDLKIDIESAQKILESVSLDLLKTIPETYPEIWNCLTMESAVRSGKIETVKFLYEKCKTVDNTSVDVAITLNSDEIFEFLVSKGHPVTKNALSTASILGDLKKIQFAYDHGFKLRGSHCSFAISHDKDEVVRFYLSKTEDRRNKFILRASLFGSPKCFSLLVDQGFEIDNEVIYGAIERDDVFMLKKIISSGKIPDNIFFEIAVNEKCTKCAEMLFDNGIHAPTLGFELLEMVPETSDLYMKLKYFLYPNCNSKPSLAVRKYKIEKQD